VPLRLHQVWLVDGEQFGGQLVADSARLCRVVAVELVLVPDKGAHKATGRAAVNTGQAVLVTARSLVVGEHWADLGSHTDDGSKAVQVVTSLECTPHAGQPV